jgi:DNA-directed RNA polymerase, subunit F (EC 2.7.7.6)
LRRPCPASAAQTGSARLVRAHAQAASGWLERRPAAVFDRPTGAAGRPLRLHQILCHSLWRLKNPLVTRYVSVKRIRRSEDITNAKALEVLRKFSQSFELSDFQRKTLDFLEKAVSMPADSAEAKVGELISRFGFARITAIQLVNLMPEDVEELKYLLQMLERREFSDDEVREMLKILQS